MADGRIKDKMARSMIYKEMKPFLPTKITQVNLCKKTYKARKHLMLFGKNEIGLDKIKLVSYIVTEILKLTNAQIQNVIDQVKTYTSNHQSYMTLIKTVPSGNDQIKTETLVQYPNLYREFSSKNFNYYGITDETLCLLCKLGHDGDESIEEKGNMIKSDKILTSEYLDWHAGLPSILTDKICSNYTKNIKKKLDMSYDNYLKL
ncbi:hypothetical protein RhiirA1_503329 [Rhizophagus irregularis]|uniref:Uncharacterized protein n=1 Tax=Rhizophagus irregularis TaxID=588596 RepID=A0A2I1FJX1_9GLOM|nr:hypothetical protein RhiirA1_503329 [Rhizophagus irregularis]PKY34671.1 hypothetical protein RhiirB3_499525 [Rhizophagus irregularis]